MKQFDKIEKPLVDKKYLLQKESCKGAWTYTIIPEILPDKHSRFGWVKVKGSIDGYEIKDYHLLPTVHGDNRLFLCVNAKIRKAIKKEAGDYVHIVLYLDNDPPELPEELLLCLQEEPEALQLFNSLSESEQHKYVKWISTAKTDETKVKRIGATIDKLLKNR